MGKPAKAVATAENSPSENLPATIAPGSADLSAFDGMSTGLENITAQDLLIPRLTILQGLSPQVSQGSPEYDPEARVGEIYDVGLQERFPGSVQFIPVHYEKKWLEWAPRASGKGLVKIHDTDAILDQAEKDDKGKMALKNGNYIAETAQLYGINVTADNRKCFLPMVSTQLKKARRLLTLATSEKVQRSDGSVFSPPLFYRVYKLSTVPESNAEGKWMGWKIERDVSVPELPNWQDLLADIKVFRDSLVKGELKGDLGGVEGEHQTQHDENAPM